MWNNMIKRAGTTWNNVVDILEDRAALPKPKPKVKPKPKEKNFQPIKKFRPRLKPKPKGPRREIVRQKAGPLPKIEQDEKDVDFDPEDRVARIVAKKKAAKPTEPGRKVSRVRRQLLFMLPGDEKILLALFAVKNGTALPGWARRYKRYLRVEGGRLHWVEDDKGGVLKLPFGTKEELRTHVKKLYFDPREPATIEAITAKLRWEWANLTKRVVTRMLRSLETYQLNFGRRRPPDIKNQPGDDGDCFSRAKRTAGRRQTASAAWTAGAGTWGCTPSTPSARLTWSCACRTSSPSSRHWATCLGEF